MSDNKLLLPDTTASVFQPRLAAWIGINEAILLQHVHYLAGREDFGAVVDGIKWIRMTTEEWAEELPCFDAHTIRRTLDNLEGDSLLISRTFSGRSKWYRVNYEALQEVNEPVERLQSRSKARAKANSKALEAKHNATVQNGHIGATTVQNGHIGATTVQNGQSQLSKMDNSSVQNGQLPRLIPRPLSDTLSPNGDSGLQPHQPLIELSEVEEPKEEIPEETLLPDTPEAIYLFEKINHNRKLKHRGPMKEFKSSEQKQKCLAAMGRLPPKELEKSIIKGLEKGLTDVASLINWIARWELPKNGKHTNGHTKTTQSNHRTGPPGAPVSASGLGEWTEDEKRRYGFS